MKSDQLSKLHLLSHCCSRFICVIDFVVLLIRVVNSGEKMDLEKEAILLMPMSATVRWEVATMVVRGKEMDKAGRSM